MASVPSSTSTCPNPCWRASRSRCAPRPARCRLRRARTGARLVAAARRWDDDLQARAARRHRRGARQRALAPVRRRLPRRLPRRVRGAGGGARHRADGEPARCPQPLGMNLYRPWKRRPGSCASSWCGAARRWCFGQPADAGTPGHEGAGRAPASHRAAGGGPDVDPRLRAAVRTGRGRGRRGCIAPGVRGGLRRGSAGEVENDDFNRLVAAARLPVHDIVVLRAYAKYMRQIGFRAVAGLHRGPLAGGQRRHCACAWSSCSRLRFDPAARRRGRGPMRRGGRADRGPRSRASVQPVGRPGAAPVPAR